MGLWLFEVLADSILVRKGLKSATAAWLAAALLLGAIAVGLASLSVRF